MGVAGDSFGGCLRGFFSGCLGVRDYAVTEGAGAFGRQFVLASCWGGKVERRHGCCFYFVCSCCGECWMVANSFRVRD